jgi:hypothetical protein
MKVDPNTKVFMNYWSSYTGGHWLAYFINQHTNFETSRLEKVVETNIGSGEHLHCRTVAYNLDEGEADEDYVTEITKPKICFATVQHNLEIDDDRKKKLLEFSSNFKEENFKIIHCLELVRSLRTEKLLEEGELWRVDNPMEIEYRRWWRKNFKNIHTVDVNKIINGSDNEYEKLLEYIEEEPLEDATFNSLMDEYKYILNYWR